MRRDACAVASVAFAALCAAGLLAPPHRVFAAQGPGAPAGLSAQAANLVERARQTGAQLLTGNDRKARDSVRKDLDEAEKITRAELKRNSACESCVETQAAVHFFRSFFKLADQYEECIEVASKGLEQFPQNAPLVYMKGFAHYFRNEPADAAVALKRFLALLPDSPQAPQIRQMLADSEQRFLGGWYSQANFYLSNESRIIVYNPQTYRNEIAFQVTPEYEMQLGQQGFAALASGARGVNDPETTAFLVQLVSRLVQKSPGPAFSFQLTIVDSPDVNAVTIPGYIIVNTGLLRFADTEPQLAGVLAHELAHNYGHHSARRLIKAYQAQNLAAAITRAVNPQTAVAQAITQLSTSVGIGLFLNAYSRLEEQEADRYGTHLMFNAGYNPTALPSFFLKLYEANPKQPIKFLSTHPPAPDRINYLSDYLESFPLDRELVVDSSDAFKRMKLRYPSAADVPAIPGPGPR